MSYNKYLYDGPVRRFGKIFDNRWRAFTYATSRSKALSNLAYRYKKDHGLVVSTKVRLSPNRLIEVEDSHIEDGIQLSFDLSEIV